jgi:TRAP-type C4-dicarboxylate transport system permease small subunit
MWISEVQPVRAIPNYTIKLALNVQHALDFLFCFFAQQNYKIDFCFFCLFALSCFCLLIWLGWDFCDCRSHIGHPLTL